MKRKTILIIMCVLLVLSILTMPSCLGSKSASGACGDSIKWKYSANETLTLKGAGAIPDCVSLFGGFTAPWRDYKISKIVIKSGITSIGAGAFYESDATSVTIPESVTKIGDSAFYGCNSLTDIYYSGTEEQWEEIVIGYGNGKINNAEIHYNHVGIGGIVTIVFVIGAVSFFALLSVAAVIVAVILYKRKNIKTVTE